MLVDLFFNRMGQTSEKRVLEIGGETPRAQEKLPIFAGILFIASGISAAIADNFLAPSDLEVAKLAAAMEAARERISPLCPEVDARITGTRTLVAMCHGEEMAHFVFDDTGNIQPKMMSFK